ncbi:MAG: tRNA (adenosine(37)-N6)-dimethylallyltransferase MiaA [Verrucomicrobiota bacterium]|jgi:tRNA dimethylallyltransferase
MANEFHFPSSILPPRPVFLAGPTAAGKSAVALALAERIGGEIISVDSMQVYRGLDIGTAKPGPEELRRVRHHLIDVAGLEETFDAAQFVRLAGAAVAQIQSRGRVPIFCGGTGLYFQACREGLGEAPPADAALRAALEAQPLAELLAELEKSDPVTFQRIDRKNPRRVIRAVEVIRLTGRPFSGQRARWEGAAGGEAGNLFGLTRPAGELRERITRRVEEMFAKGLVAETESLLARGLEQNQTARQALGYRQVAEHLRGRRSLPETVELVKIRTRQFAKRQLTWFRRQMRLEWISLEGHCPEAVAANLAAKLAAKT